MMNRCDEREIEFALHMIEQILRGQEDYLSDLQLQVIAMWMRMEMLVLELWQQENLQITDEHGKVH